MEHKASIFQLLPTRHPYGMFLSHEHPIGMSGW